MKINWRENGVVWVLFSGFIVIQFKFVGVPIDINIIPWKLISNQMYELIKQNDIMILNYKITNK